MTGETHHIELLSPSLGGEVRVCIATRLDGALIDVLPLDPAEGLQIGCDLVITCSKVLKGEKP